MVHVYRFEVLKVWVRFRFNDFKFNGSGSVRVDQKKRFLAVRGSGSGSVRLPAFQRCFVSSPTVVKRTNAVSHPGCLGINGLGEWNTRGVFFPREWKWTKRGFITAIIRNITTTFLWRSDCGRSHRWEALH